MSRTSIRTDYRSGDDDDASKKKFIRKLVTEQYLKYDFADALKPKNPEDPKSEWTQIEKSMYQFLGVIGREYQRLYIIFEEVKKDPNDPKRPLPIVNRQYFELLTIFPDDSSQSKQFLEFLHSGQSLFTKLWGA
jgi:hypothetical protein